MFVELFFLSLVGASIGSFANMLIHRLPKEEDLVFKSSYCPHCQQRLRWYDLLPILSFLYLRGRCRACQQAIGWRYLLVELVAVLLIISCFLAYGWTFLFFKTFGFLACMLVVFVIDYQHQIIPDQISWPLIVIGLALAFWQKQGLDALYGMALAFGLFFMISFLARLYYKKATLGEGDLKLVSAIGAFWGWRISLLTCYFSFILGGLVGIMLLVLKLKKRTDYIPFGPAIIAAFGVALVFGDQLWRAYFG